MSKKIYSLFLSNKISVSHSFIDTMMLQQSLRVSITNKYIVAYNGHSNMQEIT